MCVKLAETKKIVGAHDGVPICELSGPMRIEHVAVETVVLGVEYEGEDGEGQAPLHCFRHELLLAERWNEEGREGGKEETRNDI